jgi:hypothetical protein
MRKRNTRAALRLAATPVVLAGLLFAVPATAKAPVIEIGGPGGLPTPSCDGTPGNDRGKPNGLGRCSVLTRTTLYPTKDGTSANPTTVPKTSKLVAITLRLGMLKDSRRCTKYKRVKGKRVCAKYDTFAEKTYFNRTFGSGSRVRIAVLRAVKKRKGSKALVPKKTVFLGPEIRLEKWFGRTVTLPLSSPITVTKGDIVGLSVPTYAPILPVQATDNGDRWRSSRPPSGFKPVDPATGKVVTIDPDTKKRPDPCKAKWGVIFVQSAVTTAGSTADFRCRYPGTPTFQFTLIPIPT